MDFSALIMQIDNILWATPLIILTFGLALVYCIAIKFGNVTDVSLHDASGSASGSSRQPRSCNLRSQSGHV